MRAGSAWSSSCSRYVSFFAVGSSVRAVAGALVRGFAGSMVAGRAAPVPGAGAASLVAADVLLHSALAFEGERAGDDVVDERAIVADEQERARPVDQHRLEQLERLDVEIVGRLVEHQHVRRPREQPRQQQPVALAA